MREYRANNLDKIAEIRRRSRAKAREMKPVYTGRTMKTITEKLPKIAKPKLPSLRLKVGSLYNKLAAKQMYIPRDMRGTQTGPAELKPAKKPSAWDMAKDKEIW